MSGRPLAAVSLKTYLGHAATLDWVREVRDSCGIHLEAVDLLIFPVVTAICETIAIVRSTPILVGAQDCSWTEPGAFTGELPAAVIAEIGGRAVELGHAERRQLFGESDSVVARKVKVVASVGLVPLLCVGERTRSTIDEAIVTCLSQVDYALHAIPAETPVIVAYEPVWAIGGASPAPSVHIRPVCRAIRERLAHRGSGSRVLYGGTAGPGMFNRVRDDVDGLFLGRRVHPVGSLADVLEEMAQPIVSV